MTAKPFKVSTSAPPPHGEAEAEAEVTPPPPPSGEKAERAAAPVAPTLTATPFGVYAFTVYLKSDIARGDHRGQTIVVIESDPLTAAGKVWLQFGASDIANVTGPMQRSYGVQLTTPVP